MSSSTLLNGSALRVGEVKGGLSAHRQRIGRMTETGSRSRASLHPALRSRRSSVAVSAKGKAGDPPDVPKPRDQRKGGREWLESILSRFGPVKEKASNTTVLDFEKPLVELDNRIKEVGQGVPLRHHSTRCPPAFRPRHQAASPAAIRTVAPGAASGGGERRGCEQPDQGAGGARQAGAARRLTAAVDRRRGRQRRAATGRRWSLLSPPTPWLALSLPLQLRRDTYSRLTPIQRLQVARHPNRPTFLDIALNISDK